MNIIVSITVLMLLFFLYKYTYFFTKKQHKLFQFGLIIFLLFLALIDAVMGNNILKKQGITAIAGLNYVLAIMLLFAEGKYISILNNKTKRQDE